MKIWVKLLVGSILGLTLGFLLPSENQGVLGALNWFEQFALQLGRYTAVPLLFFAFILAVYQLRSDKEFWPVVGKTFLVMILSAVFVIFSGIVVTLIFPPARIPIQGIEEQIETISVNLPGLILEIFPSNMFKALFNDGAFLLPMLVMAFFIGLSFSSNKGYSRPLVSLTDSFSKIFYHIAAIFTEIIALAIIAISAYWAVHYHSILKTGVFRDLILLLGILSASLMFVIFPLFLLFLKPKTNPWIYLYGSLAQAFAAFFSGDINFTLPLIIRHVKENLGVRRRANAVTVGLFSVFGRAGSAMVAAVSLIVIIKSYSVIGFSAQDIFDIGTRTFLISFFLSPYPGAAAYMALAILGVNYGKSFESGYLILKPLIFYLTAIGTFIDVMICTFAAYVVGKTSGLQENRDVKHFI